MREGLYYSSANSSFGEVIVVWKRIKKSKIQLVILPMRNKALDYYYTHATNLVDRDISRLLEDFILFLAGEDVRFKLNLLNFDIWSDFQRKVLLAEYGIPRGYISTYGRIASYIGSPLSSRAVGRALATNPFPIIIPCHRAVRSDGSLGGYQGGKEMKKRLLEMEGVKIQGSKVLMNKVFY